MYTAVAYISNGQFLAIDGVDNKSLAALIRLLRSKGFVMRRSVKHWSFLVKEWSGQNPDGNSVELKIV